MRGYFDEEEPEPEQPRREQSQRDRELTLGTGALLGLIFALLLVCGLCFAAGYAVGHRSSTSAAVNAPTPAPDQEPLQANVSIPKPSASDQTAPQTDDSPAHAKPGSPASGKNPTTNAQSRGAREPAGSPPRSSTGPSTGSPTGSPTATAPGAEKPVRPALPSAANPTQATQRVPTVHAALPSQAQFMVQIAAVASPEDADVLAAALRKRGYSVMAKREPADGMIHVRIGPFSSRDESIRWRDKLLGDGYNAVVQP